MKVVTQEIGSGRVLVRDTPLPIPSSGHLCVRSHASVISAGTEAMLLHFGRSSLFDKIRSQPDRVKQVLTKAAADGIMPTVTAVQHKLSDEMSPGYCQAGVVIATGGSSSFTSGDRVVTNGPHAEVVRVPYNLAARIPDGVDFETAAFTPLAAIALQGLRLAQPTLGETIVVFGLGLVGQLAVQLVRAQGCRCIGIDTDADRVRIAEMSGASGLVAGKEPIVDRVRELTGGVGADAVLMTLATDSDEPIHQAAQMSRKRGRIILVGVTGMNLRRADFYEKELFFQVSCSYGPGRYDPEYEEKGTDYPLPFVRWTEQRNFEAVLALMAQGDLNVGALVTHRFPVDEAPEAYDLLLSEQASMGIVLTYPAAEAVSAADSTISLRPARPITPGRSTAGVLGAGNFARRTMLPAIRASGIDVRTIVSSGGLSAAVEGDRFDADFASSDVKVVLDDPHIDLVFVLTRHDTHADLVVQALTAGKHVFVEKPLALTQPELEAVQAAHDSAGRLLMVGFNRRYAPLTAEFKKLVDRRAGPVALVTTVNAGQIDRDHWSHDAARGGGRIVGEACHFIDLARFLVGAAIVDLQVQSAARPGGERLEDISHLVLSFEDGSTAAIHYLANGSPRFPKERVEAFFDGKTVAIDNWRRLKTWGFGRRDRLFARRMDKGHEAELAAFVEAVRAGGPPPIPIDELLEVSRWSILAARLARDESGVGD